MEEACKCSNWGVGAGYLLTILTPAAVGATALIPGPGALSAASGIGTGSVVIFVLMVVPPLVVMLRPKSRNR